MPSHRTSIYQVCGWWMRNTLSSNEHLMKFLIWDGKRVGILSASGMLLDFCMWMGWYLDLNGEIVLIGWIGMVDTDGIRGYPSLGDRFWLSFPRGSCCIWVQFLVGNDRLRFRWNPARNPTEKNPTKRWSDLTGFSWKSSDSDWIRCRMSRCSDRIGRSDWITWVIEVLM